MEAVLYGILLIFACVGIYTCDYKSVIHTDENLLENDKLSEYTGDDLLSRAVDIYYKMNSNQENDYTNYGRSTDLSQGNPVDIKKYDLIIAPQFYSNEPSTFYFDGHIEITFECNTPTNQIRLHSHKLMVNKYKLDITNDNHIEGSNVAHEIIQMVHYDDMQRIRFKLSEHLQINQVYRLTIKYTGQIQQGTTHGVFIQKYLDSLENVQWMFGTTLRPNLARTLFPCVDVPSEKAQIQLSVLYKEGMTVLTNSPKIHQQGLTDEWNLDIFEPAMLGSDLSTFHIAVVIFRTGDWLLVNSLDVHGIPIQLWFPASLQNNGGTVSDNIISDIQFFEEYLNFSIPLSKIDLFGLLEYHTNAFEHPGLITFRADLLKVSGSPSYDRTATIITHELAHQWFGNSVTPEMWGDLWMSEGLAYILTKKALMHHHEYLEYSKRNQLNQKQVLRMDHNQQPIYKLFNSTSPYEEIYNSLNVVKGNAVADILEKLVGADIFQQTMTSILQEYSFGCLSLEAFTQILSINSNDLVTSQSIMPWFTTQGYPLVKLNLDGNTLVMVCLLQNYETPTETLNTPFPGSLTLDYLLKTDTKSLRVSVDFHGNNKPMEVIFVSGHLEYILLNPEGFYVRVLYETTLWDKLIQALTSSRIVFDETARTVLLEDAYEFSKLNLIASDVFERLFNLICKDNKDVMTDACKYMSYI